jgi:pentatricopeptide repeat protein
MMESGLQLNQFTYKALIHGFCKAKELDEAKEAFFQMVDAGALNASYIFTVPVSTTS